MQSSNPRFLEILRVLTRHRVEFVVVGGVSAVLQGAPVTTFDLDVVHSRSPENISRLLGSLHELEAVYRFQPERALRPDESRLASAGHQLLLTKFGPLDVLGAIGRARGWEDLVDHSRELDVEPAVVVRVLDLDILIAVKEELGFPKDLAVLPILREALRRKSEG